MIEKKNVIGEKYHMLEIIDNAPSRREPSGKLVKRVIVKCDCGNTNDISYKNLKRGITKSCGCLQEKQKTPVNIGDTFNNWTLIEETKPVRGKRSFKVQCVCGKEAVRPLYDLRKDKSKSCGCKGLPKKEMKQKITPKDTEEEQWKQSITYPNYYISTLGRVFNYRLQIHKIPKRIYKLNKNNRKISISIVIEMYKTFIGEIPKNSVIFLKGSTIKLENIYSIETNTERGKKLRGIYANMKSRCSNPNCRSYSSYGAKGISIDESFNTFKKFFQWSITNGYEPNIGLEIDRIEGHKNYSEDNCRWVTKNENLLNQKNINLTLKDVAWIRSDDFSIEESLSKFTCSEYVIRNIRDYVTFKNLK